MHEPKNISREGKVDWFTLKVEGRCSVHHWAVVLGNRTMKV